MSAQFDAVARWVTQDHRSTILHNKTAGSKRFLVATESTSAVARQTAFLGPHLSKTSSNEKKEWQSIHRTLSFRRTEDII
jgi:hypothetical protein